MGGYVPGVRAFALVRARTPEKRKILIEVVLSGDARTSDGCRPDAAGGSHAGDADRSSAWNIDPAGGRILPKVSGGEADAARSMRAAAAAIGVTPIVISRWIERGDLGEPPWPLEDLRRLHAEARPSPGAQADHGTLTRYAMGCNCEACLTAQRDYQREQVRAKAQQRFPHELRQQLLDALGSGTPFRQAIADLGLSSRRVWGLAQHDREWSQGAR